MRRTANLLSVLFPAVGMLILILDSRTALLGASEGVEICVRTVIPSLLPFFVLSILLTNNLAGKKLKLFSPLGKLCGIPEGAEPLLLVGLLGGYPVGAQCVARAWRNGQLNKQDAHRLLGFCSNAGPAFIFGIAGSLFSSQWQAWLLWLIHIVTALTVAAILPGKSRSRCSGDDGCQMTVSQGLLEAIRVLAGVCGWIILFRVLIAFFSRWFLWLLPVSAQVLISGLLELANGCIQLLAVDSMPVRFVLASAMLGFGGICVGMQTVSVVKDLGTGWYFPGKLLQGFWSLLLSLAIQFGIHNGYTIICLFICVMLTVAVRLLSKKKAVAFSESIVYNGENAAKEIGLCCSAKKSRDPVFTALTAPK